MRTQLEMFRNRVSLEMEMPQPAGRFNIVLRDAVQKRHLPWADALIRSVLDGFNFRLVSEHKRAVAHWLLKRHFCTFKTAEMVKRSLKHQPVARRWFRFNVVHGCFSCRFLRNLRTTCWSRSQTGRRPKWTEPSPAAACSLTRGPTSERARLWCPGSCSLAQLRRRKALHPL